MSDNVLIVNDLGAILRRRKLHMVIPAAFILLLSGVLAYVLPRIYVSTSTITIEKAEIPESLIASTVTGYAEERIEMARSRTMTRDNLWGIAEKFDLYPGMRTAENREDVIMRMRQDITMTLVSAGVINPKSGNTIPTTIAFTVSYENESPELAQAVTAELAELYLSENRKSRTEYVRQASLFLTDETQRAHRLVSDIEAKIAAFKEKNAGSLPGSFANTSESLDRSRQELAQLDSKLSPLESRYAFLRNRLTGFGGPSAQLTKARAELAAAREKFFEIHPDVMRLKQTVETLEAEDNKASGSMGNDSASSDPAYLELQSELQGVAGDIDAIRSRRASLIKQIAEYQLRLAQSPEVERGFSALTRDLDHAVSEYDKLMGKLKSAQLAEELERGQKAEHFSLIEKANYPSKPSKPNIPGLILLGLTFALGAGVGVSALAEHLDHRIHGPKELAAVFKAPPIAIIPEIPG